MIIITENAVNVNELRGYLQKNTPGSKAEKAVPGAVCSYGGEMGQDLP